MTQGEITLFFQNRKKGERVHVECENKASLDDVIDDIAPTGAVTFEGTAIAYKVGGIWMLDPPGYMDDADSNPITSVQMFNIGC